MARRTFTREFKLEAVKLVRERGVTMAQAARDLGVHDHVLRRWVREYVADTQQAFPGQGQMKPDQLELERLRREVTKLKAERDILKKPRWVQPINATPSGIQWSGRVIVMGQMGRPGLSATQKAELWQRWKQGQSLSEIGRALGKHAGSIHGVVSSNGGFIPPIRRRSRWALTLAEREEISRGLAMRGSIRQIAAKLGRAPSTISREIHRHGGAHRYRASEADTRAWDRARRPKRCRLATQPSLQRLVARKLILDWSPEQIAGWLKQTFPDQDTMRISHETIYRSLFIQARGVLKKNYWGISDPDVGCGE